MTAATLPAPGNSLLGKTFRALRSRARTGAGRKRIDLIAAKFRAHAVTAAALSAADMGGFSVFHHGGWFVLAASLLLFHFDVEGPGPA